MVQNLSPHTTPRLYPYTCAVALKTQSKTVEDKYNLGASNQGQSKTIEDKDNLGASNQAQSKTIEDKDNLGASNQTQSKTVEDTFTRTHQQFQTKTRRNRGGRIKDVNTGSVREVVKKWQAASRVSLGVKTGVECLSPRTFSRVKILFSTAHSVNRPRSSKWNIDLAARPVLSIQSPSQGPVACRVDDGRPEGGCPSPSSPTAPSLGPAANP
ncbi:hypothetical protein J6590_011482 [Homalodisca vitripennis]|nr:hypothetical protein J6590_011482 [Homalodisca vitripennis]